VKSFEEIRTFLAEKIKIEKKRLKSYSTHANPFDLSNAIARHVEALMSSSRYDELKMLEHFLEKKKINSNRLTVYVKDRKKGLKNMKEALNNTAEETDRKRPWRYQKH
jgi:hypothetical protein